MTVPLVECVPNFSEGRDAHTVAGLLAAIESVPGALVLDHTSDADHHRSVVTFVGEPQAVLEAAIRVVGRAAELIDLRSHSGVHPRVGAADVIPFVPINGITLEDCVELSRRCAQAVWERYRVPSYFYEASATHPDRVRLENLRRSSFAGAFDTGDRFHSGAGVSIIGARRFLIAWNVNLSTPDVRLAKTIARHIRESSGGLPAVKALGLELVSKGQTQVSMNLVDFERTPLHQVFAAISEHAARAGVGIAGSELIGLIPSRALEASAGHDLHWINWTPDCVLETRIAQRQQQVEQRKAR